MSADVGRKARVLGVEEKARILERVGALPEEWCPTAGETGAETER